MPELPEVETTVRGLREAIVGLFITDAWSDYDSLYYRGADDIRNPTYFKRFKKEATGTKVISIERRAKNILISLNHGKTILIHMKMTGHLLFGEYRYEADSKGKNFIKNRPGLRKDSSGNNHHLGKWIPVRPDSLKDPFNRHVHFVLSFGDKKHLALSDARKFAKITLLPTIGADETKHLEGIGPEPLYDKFYLEDFIARLRLRLNGKIKQVLMDQKIVAGIGNIYSDEILWYAGIHPLQKVKDISPAKARAIFMATKRILSKSISLGGDSMSDYRDIRGKKGRFQEFHNAYKRTG